MKHYLLAVVLVLLLTTSAAAATAGVADSQATVTLEVSVTDRFNNGIDGAELTAHWDGGSSTATTASNGKAFVDVEEGADVRLFVNHSAYTKNNPVVIEDAGQQDVALDVFQTAEATVSVVDDGAGVDGARVVLTKVGQDRPAATGRTDGSGTFESGTVEEGPYTVSVVKEGYRRNETTISVEGTTDATVALTEDTATVTFEVVDDQFESPQALEDVEIQIDGPTRATVSTSGSGEAQIGLAVNAEFTVTVTKDGYVSTTRAVTVGETSETVRFAISREPALNVSASNERVVVGERVRLEVTDEYGETVEGATVSVDGEQVGSTNADGVYRATIDSEGDHTIAVENNGTSAEVTVEGVSTGGGAEDTATATDAATGTGGPDLPLDRIGQPNTAIQIGVAAVGVLVAFIVVRSLL
jgi:hypothetical protein